MEKESKVASTFLQGSSEVAEKGLLCMAPTLLLTTKTMMVFDKPQVHMTFRAPLHHADSDPRGEILLLWSDDDQISTSGCFLCDDMIILPSSKQSFSSLKERTFLSFLFMDSVDLVRAAESAEVKISAFSPVWQARTIRLGQGSYLQLTPAQPPAPSTVPGSSREEPRKE